MTGSRRVPIAANSPLTRRHVGAVFSVRAGPSRSPAWHCRRPQQSEEIA